MPKTPSILSSTIQCNQSGEKNIKMHKKYLLIPVSNNHSKVEIKEDNELLNAHTVIRKTNLHRHVH